MEYKEKYEMALERAKEQLETAKVFNYKEGQIAHDIRTTTYAIFPELKEESEDEKTERILHSISSKMSLHLCDTFTEEEFQCFDTWSNAWLEKQGEQKHAWSEEDELVVEDIEEAVINYWHGQSQEDLLDWLKSLKQRIWTRKNLTRRCRGTLTK